jgi:hypothetical protein
MVEESDVDVLNLVFRHLALPPELDSKRLHAAIDARVAGGYPWVKLRMFLKERAVLTWIEATLAALVPSDTFQADFHRSFHDFVSAFSAHHA